MVGKAPHKTRRSQSLQLCVTKSFKRGKHTPVLLKEILEFFKPEKDKLYIDCTLGLGGHAGALLEQGARVIAIDADQASKKLAEANLGRFGSKFKAYLGNFADVLGNFTPEHEDKIDGILADLGLSSWQLEQSQRGFSFKRDEPLDMRMADSKSAKGIPIENIKGTAAWIINTYKEKELANLIYGFGEERLSRKIARVIVITRKKDPIRTTAKLAQLVVSTYPPKLRFKSKIHPATRTFQALRIAVNNELESLEQALPIAIKLLKNGGRIAVISFHSLEDRIVKNFFRDEAAQGNLKILTKKPVSPSVEEVSKNPRSRSAKLRVAERITTDI